MKILQMKSALSKNAQLRSGGVHHRRGKGVFRDRSAVDRQSHLSGQTGKSRGEIARIRFSGTVRAGLRQRTTGKLQNFCEQWMIRHPEPNRVTVLQRRDDGDRSGAVPFGEFCRESIEYDTVFRQFPPVGDEPAEFFRSGGWRGACR